MSEGNGVAVGQRYVIVLKSYLDGGGIIPLSPKDGTLNISELVRTTGIPRSSFYQNIGITSLIDEQCKLRGIERQPERNERSAAEKTLEGSQQSSKLADVPARSKALERRVHQLEQQNAGLVAENFELRKQVKNFKLQLGRDDMQIETGRRIPRPVERE